MCRAVSPKPSIGMKPSPKHPPELVLHDQVNLIALPLLTVASLAGLLGLCESFWVTVLFMGYVIFDFAWLYLYPTSVPSLSNVILAHHVVTLLLLTFPFRHRDYGHFTCWDGLTELNTWFLVLRRQWSQHRQLWDGLYWVTFIPQRLVMYPALLLKFWMVLGSFPLQERLLVCVCQFLLCCFNFGVFYLSVRRRASKGTDSTVPKQAVSCPGKMDSSAGLKPHQTKNVVIRAHGGTLA